MTRGSSASIALGRSWCIGGWHAQETYVVHGPDEFEEVFELAQSAKPFEVYSRARLKRVR